MFYQNLLQQLKIRTKLTLIIVSLITMIVIGILRSVYSHEKNIILSEAEVRASDITTMLAFNSVQAILLDDYLTLQNLIDSISNRKGVLEAMLFNNDGLILAHNHTGKRGTIINDSDSKQAITSQSPLYIHRNYKGKRILDISYPVFVASKKEATARILFSIEESYQAIQKSMNYILIIGLTGLFISVLLVYMVTHVLTNSLLELLEALKRAGAGQRNIQIPINSSDEIGELRAAFNKMIADIDILENNIRTTERITAFGLMGASLAHRIKTPFTSIQTFVELLPEKYDDPKFRMTFQKHVLQQINNLSNVITELSNFSQKKTLSQSMTDINQTVMNVAKTLQQKIRNSDIELDTQLDPLPLTMVDEKQLTEAFLIIGENAIEAMGGNGRLTIRTLQNSTDSFGSETNNRFFCVTFSDTGNGIPTENQEKIFDPFYTTKTKGMGLGLAICDKIIKRHHGTIHIQSEPGKGTTFNITLPINSNAENED
ncbi:HAMP domain-containing protein [candidate division KSB1 bacterium]|nr:HAMP domain-containing protein [candidate division KSB1 bacterium]